MVLLCWGSFLLFPVCYFFIMKFQLCQMFFLHQLRGVCFSSFHSANVNAFNVVEPSLLSRSKWNLVMVYKLFHMLNSVCWYCAEEFCMNARKGFWSVVLFSYIVLWCQDNAISQNGLKGAPFQLWKFWRRLVQVFSRIH